MSFSIDDLRGHTITCTHPGGVSRITHYIDSIPYCFEPLEGREDQYCANEAGMGTAHFGSGSCYLHWGNVPNAITKQGYGKYLKREIRERYLQFAEQDEITALNLRPELDILKTLLTSTMDAYTTTNSTKALELSLRVLDNISNTVDRIDRIQSRQTLTAAMARTLMLKAIATAKQFIPIEHLPAFLDLWRAEVQSIVELPQRPTLEIPGIANYVEDEQ